ncbi:MAG TPA: glycosyltransferase [Vicinamibacterales bacterium]|nr:glycosyltransferase [Vicinamibacterales bacterium]
MSRTRLVVVSPSLGGGGAERHMLRILPVLERAFDVSIASLRSGGDLRGDVPPDVPVHAIGTLGWLGAARRLRVLLERERPAVVLAFQEAANIPVLLACRMLSRSVRPAIVISTQSAPAVVLADARPRTRWRLSMAMRLLYPTADRIVAASTGVTADLAALAPGTAGRVRVIYNAGIDATVVERAREPWTHPFADAGVPLLVACGRLADQKDYPTLIEAIATLRVRRDVRLVVLGDGPLRTYLELDARLQGVEAIVSFAGYASNPYPAMRRADVFVLSSRSEGFGNVLVEALALARPIVSTDCPHGPREILDGDRYGWLVPPGDPAALAAALDRLLGDAAAREALGTAGPGRAALFTAERSGAAYVDLVCEALASRAGARTPA